jgi:phenylpropionate dioxygenase-like ring-hydroxylating dioxygenase large terminal subunit/AcrR family transcriptional regulator
MAATLEKPLDQRPTGSRLDLINATVAAISRHGLSDLTSAKIASIAGHTAASINFHFGGKEALLLATLREVSEEFAESMAASLAGTRGAALESLLAIIDVSLSLRLSESRKVAVWYAFLAESNARKDYQRICGDRDESFCATVTALCREIIAAHEVGPGGLKPDAEALSLGLTGLIDQLWQNILFVGDEFDRDAAKRRCRSYLASVFPWLAARVAGMPANGVVVDAVRRGAGAPANNLSPEPEAGPPKTLPAWVYCNEDFHELEKEKLFAPAWQIVCHANELSKPGDYVTFEFFNRRGFVVRDDGGELRAFHNVCAHRAHALVAGERGTCAKVLTCPYHGWTYHLDGRNRSVSAPDTFPKFDRSKFGLKPIELEVFSGFVFVRFESGGESVATRMAPHAAELAHYKIADMVPLDDLWVKDVEIDWKNLVENYVEDYHFPMGHPGLSALMEKDYDREVLAGGTMRLSHQMRAEPGNSWSARGYAKFLPVIEHLPENMRRRWTYLGLFPNVFFDIYPEWMDFFQVIPIGPGRTRIRARSYGFVDDRREMKAARWFCRRLNVRVQREDEELTASVQQGLASGGYTQGVLSEKEVVLAGFQDWIRARIPVAKQTAAPTRGTTATRNAEMSA